MYPKKLGIIYYVSCDFNCIDELRTPKLEIWHVTHIWDNGFRFTITNKKTNKSIELNAFCESIFTSKKKAIEYYNKSVDEVIAGYLTKITRCEENIYKFGQHIATLKHY